MTDAALASLTMEELADLADVGPEEVGRLAGLGFLAPDAEGRFRPGDVHRVRIVEAFTRSGITLEALADAQRRGLVSFAYYDQLHPAPSTPSTRTYGRLRHDLGPRATLLAELVRALSLAEPAPDSRLPRDDEAILLKLLDIVEGTGAPDLGLRVARLIGDGLRRSMEAVLDVYGEAAARSAGSIAGVPSEEVNRRFLEPWNRYARIAPELGRWLTARHLSDAIDSFSVTTSERYLMEAGLVPPREDTPPGVAFVDLTGFTRVAAEHGDEPAARLALRFGRLADEAAARHQGRLVKLLGDGALLRFGSGADALEATLALLRELPVVGLPEGHAGIDAGPLVARDGDIFGKTVNLASRLSDRAEPGSILLSAATARAIADMADGREIRFEPRGSEHLPGFPEPIELVRVTV